MQIRLDPPELGPLMISVRVVNGVVSAAFEASSADAARMLGNGLGQLKAALEAQGVTVERLQVQQQAASRDPGSSQSGGEGERQQASAWEQWNNRQDRQRQEILRRLWQRVSGDPLDLVA